MGSFEKWDNTEFLSQSARGETKRNQLNIRVDLADKWLDSKLCGE